MQDHSALPWELFKSESGGYAGRIESDCYVVAEFPVYFEQNRAIEEANAEFIVKAVNSHYDMRNLLEEAARYLRHNSQTDLLVERIEKIVTELKTEISK